MNNATEITVVNCESWAEFQQRIRQRDGAPLDPIFRGQRDISWGLVSPKARPILELRALARRLPEGMRGREDVLQRIQDNPARLRHLATGLPGVDVTALSDDELLALGRHNGLVTNLLDWSISPYVAAFFAFSDALDELNEGALLTTDAGARPTFLTPPPVAVWRLGVSEKTWGTALNIVKARSRQNYWLLAQDGLFTRLKHERHVDLVDYLADIDQANRLTKFIIPGAECAKALGDLRLMNIDFARLFPDLTGVARQMHVDALRFILGG